MSGRTLLRAVLVGVCTVPLTGCMAGMMGMPGMGGGQQPQAQANDSGVGSTAGEVAGGQMAKSVPFGSAIGGLVGRKTEQTVRTQKSQQPAQPASATQTP